MPWVAVDGGIAVGKSTIMAAARAAGIHTLPEPVGDPESGEKGAWDDALAAMYAGVPGASFAFQQRVAQDRALAPHVVAGAAPGGPWGMLERSPDMQRRTFVTAYEGDERDQLERTYEHAASLWRPAAIVYLRMAPDVSHARMLGRGRACEAGVTLEYPTWLHDAHEAAVLALRAEGVVPVFVVDVGAHTSVADVSDGVVALFNSMSS